jgi:hypothetical protein
MRQLNVGVCVVASLPESMVQGWESMEVLSLQKHWQSRGNHATSASCCYTCTLSTPTKAAAAACVDHTQSTTEGKQNDETSLQPWQQHTPVRDPLKVLVPRMWLPNMTPNLFVVVTLV